MIFAEEFEKFTDDANEKNIAHRLDYHLCICQSGNEEPYYAMVEYSRFGWVIQEEDVEILAYCELALDPTDVLSELGIKQKTSE